MWKYRLKPTYIEVEQAFRYSTFLGSDFISEKIGILTIR